MITLRKWAAPKKSPRSSFACCLMQTYSLPLRFPGMPPACRKSCPHFLDAASPRIEGYYRLYFLLYPFAVFARFVGLRPGDLQFLWLCQRRSYRPGRHSRLLLPYPDALGLEFRQLFGAGTMGTANACYCHPSSAPFASGTKAPPASQIILLPTQSVATASSAPMAGPPK